MPNYANPQALNRYSYVNNAPLNYVDPSGHDADYFCSGSDDYSSSCTGYVQSQATLGSGGNGDGGGGGGDSLEDDLQQLENAIEQNFFYNPYFGGSSSGCNTWTLWNGSDWCHHTTYTPQPICLVHCAPRDQWEYALRFQYPGQSPHDPVVGGREERHVMGGDFVPWQWLRDKGAITVSIDGQTIINATEKTHIFHQGDIYRTVSGGHVTTEGYGTNTNLAVAALNQYGGPVAFKIHDFVMTSISTLDKLSGGALLP